MSTNKNIIMIVLGLLVVAGIYTGVQYLQGVSNTASTTPITQDVTPVATAPRPADTVPVAATATTPIPTPVTGMYKDGSYKGISADSIYGPVQVSATIAGGKLTAVTILDYPKDRDDSQVINERAIPVLKSEAIIAQSAKVHNVSGATQTTEAFSTSLQSALVSAKA